MWYVCGVCVCDMCMCVEWYREVWGCVVCVM